MALADRLRSFVTRPDQVTSEIRGAIRRYTVDRQRYLSRTSSADKGWAKAALNTFRRDVRFRGQLVSTPPGYDGRSHAEAVLENLRVIAMDTHLGIRIVLDGPVGRGRTEEAALADLMISMAHPGTGLAGPYDKASAVLANVDCDGLRVRSTIRMVERYRP